MTTLEVTAVLGAEATNQVVNMSMESITFKVIASAAYKVFVYLPASVAGKGEVWSCWSKWESLLWTPRTTVKGW